MRVLLVDDNAERQAMVRAALVEAGHEIVAFAAPRDDLRAVVETSGADVIVASLSTPDRDTIEGFRLEGQAPDRPVVMFVDQAGAPLAADAVRAGVAAYIVDGLQPARVAPILGVAVARFEEFRRLQNELALSRSALEDRKLIDRAKGLLMDGRGLSEKDAYGWLRQTAMAQSQRMVDVARGVIALGDLLKK
ncbi:MAG: ANTAR domain-containing protein [Pseudomonadota bacterium]